MVGAESIMTFALGFLIASLVALVLAAPLWRRAEKVTRKRLEKSLPLSAEDIAADKDKLRADFALSTRKLELSLEKLRKKTQTQMTSVHQNNGKLVELKSELKNQTDAKTDDEALINELNQRLAHSEAELKRRTDQMDEMKSKLGDLQHVLDRQAGAIQEAASLTEGHRDEIESLKSDVTEKSENVAKQAKSISARDRKLAECGERVATQKLLVAEKTEELEKQLQIVAALQSEIDANKTKLTAKEDQAEALKLARAELETANLKITELNAQITNVSDDYQAHIISDNRENALLRQRIADLVTDVQQMTDAVDLVGKPHSSASVPLSAAAPSRSAAKALSSLIPSMTRAQKASNALPPIELTNNSGAKDKLKQTLPIEALGNGAPDTGPYPGAGEAAIAKQSESLADRIRSLQRGILR